MLKRWEVAPPVSSHHVDRFADLPPWLVQVLWDRKVREPTEVDDFLSGRWVQGDVFSLPDMQRAVDILIRSIKRREPIAVYGDFDADGVTATALLVQTLVGLGADVQHYIPSRVDEGYGLNLDALRELYNRKVRVVVTVDCGIRALEEVAKARRGLELIITDHHSVGPALPPASAVINPKRPDSTYPFAQFAGVGVAFKLAQALIREAADCRIPVHVEEDALLDLVALGTVADLAPLRGENRWLVMRGLEVLNQARREGVRALLRVAGVRPGAVSTSTIGFGLGPRLNAAGRLGDASLSYRVLVTGDAREAERLAAHLDEQNRRRQALTAEAYQRAEQMALADGVDAPLLFAADEAFPSGIVGLVAGRFTETYYRPAVIVEKGDEFCKGSCRSISEFHITQALDQCHDLLVRYGGHAAAAGFTVRTDKLEELAHRLAGIASQQLQGMDLAPTLKVDAEVPLAEMDWAAAEWTRQMEPCGQDNAPPCFLSRRVPVASARAVGAEGRHLRLALRTNGEQRDAIAFRMGDRLPELGDVVDLVYALEINEWNGEKRLQLNVRDVVPSAT